MGSYIILGINKMEIDWGKNNNFSNHSKLFQKEDFDKDIPYYYVDDDGNEIIKYEKGAQKPLLEVKERIELLGYDLKSLKKKYYEARKEYEFYTGEKINITFNEYFLFVKSIDVLKVNNITTSIESFENGYELGEYFDKCILEDEEIAFNIKQIVKKFKSKNKYGDVGEFFETIDPYITLRILAENPNNLKYFIEWRYEDVIEGGWVRKEDILIGLEESNKILIVTEGNTDSFVIKKTIEELYPSISDFFEFIDMKENYPFTGVGSLANFCLGLSKIHIQNNIIALFDNDTAGNELYNKVKDIKEKPKNLVFCKLPKSKLFNNFDTIGPSGKKKININGNAVAIECFLDFSSVRKSPIVRWQNYKDKMNQYQGALENKELYINKFKTANLKDGSYNCDKLRLLIEHIIDSWKNR